ncbi:MAG: peroxiredoxin [Flammeovirgaceae bacterium]|jgi:peroxiredoxin
MLKIGDKAPDFILKNTEQKEVSLKDFEGKNLVILFFPLAFTSVCTAELCEIRDNYSQYEAIDATVVGVSIDSPFALAKFKEQENYNFDLLSDFNKEASEAYGALYEDLMGLKGVSKRASFVVGKDGTLKYATVLPSPGDMPNFDEIKEAIEK